MEKQKKKTKSKGQIEKRIRRKRNVYLVETLMNLKKSVPEIAKELAKPRRQQKNINLSELDKKIEKIKSSEILFLGKILSSGDLTKKVRIIALSASQKAIEKIKKSGSSFAEIKEELKKNPKLNSLEIIN